MSKVCSHECWRTKAAVLRRGKSDASLIFGEMAFRGDYDGHHLVPVTAPELGEMNDQILAMLVQLPPLEYAEPCCRLRPKVVCAARHARRGHGEARPRHAHCCAADGAIMYLPQKSADVIAMDISHKIRKQSFVLPFNKLEHTLGSTKVFNLAQVDYSDEMPLLVDTVRIYSHHEADDIKRVTGSGLRDHLREAGHRIAGGAPHVIHPRGGGAGLERRH